MFAQSLLGSVVLIAQVLAAPTIGNPTVTLDQGIFTGNADVSTHKFLGIPFAKPPVGDLRFRLPQTVPSYSGTYDATQFGPSCPQETIQLPLLTGLAQDAVDFVTNLAYGSLVPSSEDCLTINVIKPISATTNSNLPVVFWIFGGGFAIGSPVLNDGATVVSRSIELGMPVIHVSVNYRLSGFGFLPGKEVKAAGVGNLGLHDQREALRWVQKYITNFGGDPTKVTIWGESAGAISASLHMLANGGNTEGLFRAAFMESGAPIPVGDITHGQIYYDNLVSQTGCSGSSDTLACLRQVPYSDLKAAMDQAPGLMGYQSLNLVWLPRMDGVFLADNPQTLVQQGKIANIPFVTGNNDDEGTLFALSKMNITTESQFRSWVSNIFMPGFPDGSLDKLMELYPSDITQGSPFDTGIFNAITPQFKRIAAFLGDSVFQAPRRWFLQNALKNNRNVWVYLSKRFKILPVLGSAHATDLLNVYGNGDMADFLIRFATNLDPSSQWPRYTLGSPKLMTFLDGIVPLHIGDDTYREAAMDFLTTVCLANPL